MPFEVDPDVMQSLFASGGEGGEALMSPTTLTPAPEMSVIPEAKTPTLIESLAGGASSAWKSTIRPLLESGLLSSLMGTALGPGSAIGRVSTATGGALQAKATGEQYRKLLSAMLAGIEGGAGGPLAGSPTTSSIMELGMTPAGVEKFYGATLEAAERARKAPLEEIATLANAEHAKAGATKNFAEALKISEEVGYAGADRIQKALKFIQDMAKGDAEMAYKNLLGEQAAATAEKTRTETTALKREAPAREEKLGAEAKKTKLEAEALTPAGRAEAEAGKIRVGRATTPAQLVNLGGTEAQISPFPTKERIFQKTEAPGVGKVTFPEAAKESWKFTTGHFFPVLQRELTTKYGNEKAKQQMDQLLYTLGQYPEAERSDLLLARLSPEMQARYREAWTLYQTGMQAGMNPARIGAAIDAAMGVTKPSPEVMPGAAATGANPKEFMLTLPIEERKALVNFIQKQYKGKTEVEQDTELARILQLPADQRAALVGAKPATTPAKNPAKAPSTNPVFSKPKSWRERREEGKKSKLEKERGE